MAEYILALDAGGTAVKAAIYDIAGRECAVAGETLSPIRPAPGHNERDPELMWTAVCRVTRKAIEVAGILSGEIAVVGLTGYGNGLYLVDGKGTPVRNGILSSDQRAASITERWCRQGLEPRHLEMTNQKIWAGKPLPLIQWLEENEAPVLDRAQHLLMCKDFLRLRLTGRLALEITDMSSGSLFDHAARRWTPAVIEHVGLGHHARLFGDPLESLAIAGTVTPEAAEATGLMAGTPVSAGFADNLAMATALGIVDESHLHVVSGTWGLNQLIADSAPTDGSILAAMVGATPGKYVLVDGGATSASTFEWFVDTIVAPAIGAGDHSSVYAWCNEKLADARDSDPPVYFLPYLNGLLDIPAARGSFIGLSGWHGLPHMIRAVFEGVALEHRQNIERLLAGRPRPTAARFAGGAARSRPWLDIFAATLDMPIELGTAKELGALGAAIIAAVSAGLYPDLESGVAGMTHVRERIEPDPGKVALMEKRYRSYLVLRECLEPAWSRI